MKDPVQRAVKKSSSATNLFTKAKAELDKSNELLTSAIQDDLDEMERLNERVSFARSQHQNNERVANKLAEFVS